MYMVISFKILSLDINKSIFLEEPNLAMKNARLMYKMKEGAKS